VEDPQLDAQRRRRRSSRALLLPSSAPSPSPQKPLANPPKGDLFGEISHFFSSAHNRPILARAIALGVLLRHAGGIERYASRLRAFAA
jgi:hypothetical protein